VVCRAGDPLGSASYQRALHFVFMQARRTVEDRDTERPARGCEVLCESPSELIATAGDCLLVVVRTTLSTEGVSAIQRGFEQLERAHKRVGYLSYIDGDKCTVMEASARGLMAHVLRRHTRRIALAAIVVGGESFRAAVVRRILAGIHLASRAEHPMSPFRALEPALDWYEATWPEHSLARHALREALVELHPGCATTASPRHLNR
jgi:hypothetical protein